MSIVRIGLGETKKFAEGYEAIFGKRKAASGEETPKPARASGKSAKKGSKKAGKKK